jgi:hypothetical protein
MPVIDRRKAARSKVLDAALIRFGDVQARCTHAVSAGFILLDLLKRDAEFLTKLLLAYSERLPLRAHALADVLVDRARASRPKFSLGKRAKGLIRLDKLTVGVFNYWTRSGSRSSSLNAASWREVGLEWSVKRCLV